jgi:hypothetical protein
LAALKIWDDSEIYTAIDDDAVVENTDGTLSVVGTDVGGVWADDVDDDDAAASSGNAYVEGATSTGGTSGISEDGSYGFEMLDDEASDTFGTFTLDSTGAVQHDPVSVTLCKNGEAYETVQLSADNSWRYEWSGLDASAKWTLFEDSADMPAGYTRTTVLEDDVFVVTNAYTPDDPAAVPPDTDEPTVDKPTQITTTTDKPSQITTKLAQTGQLWWPVVVLGCAGVVCLLVSTLLRRRE